MKLLDILGGSVSRYFRRAGADNLCANDVQIDEEFARIYLPIQ